jgi:hypothetical protein
MQITDVSAYPSVNAWLRTLTHDSFQAHELFVQYLRWLDQSYGATVTCALHADHSATISVHGTPELTIVVAHGRICVRWLRPEAGYWAILHGAVSKPDDLTQSASGAWWQFYLDTRQDGYLLRDLTSHLHR